MFWQTNLENFSFFNLKRDFSLEFSIYAEKRLTPHALFLSSAEFSFWELKSDVFRILKPWEISVLTALAEIMPTSVNLLMICRFFSYIIQWRCWQPGCATQLHTDGCCPSVAEWAAAQMGWGWSGCGDRRSLGQQGAPGEACPCPLVSRAAGAPPQRSSRAFFQPRGWIDSNWFVMSP